MSLLVATSLQNPPFPLPGAETICSPRWFPETIGKSVVYTLCDPVRKVNLLRTMPVEKFCVALGPVGSVATCELPGKAILSVPQIVLGFPLRGVWNLALTKCGLFFPNRAPQMVQQVPANGPTILATTLVVRCLLCDRTIYWVCCFLTYVSK